MKANEFVKEYGWDAAKQVIGSTEVGGINTMNITELKRLVESHELVEKHGGLFQSKVQLDKFGFSGGLEWHGFNGEYGLTDDSDLKQAIADVESCQKLEGE